MSEISATKEKQCTKLNQNLEEQSKKLKNTEDDLKKAKQEAEKYHKALSNLKDGLQSNMNIVESALLKSRSRSARNSPLTRRDSDPDCGSHSNKNKTDIKTEKETNGLNNGNCEASTVNVQIKAEKTEEQMDAD